MSGFEMKGGEEMARRIAGAAAGARRGQVRGLELAGQHVLGVSNSQVPHELGDLERDGAASVDPDTLTSAVSYGRNPETAKYAVPQHERMDYVHDAGRNAKYLENAFNSERQVAAQIITEQTRRGMGT